MEIRSEGGSKFALKWESKAVFGRGHGFRTDDKTVSRNHLSFYFRSQTDPRVSFQVLGKNPVWVRRRSGGEIRVFRSSEKAELVSGDEFCVSGKSPVWFALKKLDFAEEKQEQERETAEDLRSVDVSGIDVVEEFGFLVMGHEFDCYPKQRILHMKDWDWFLEEHEQGSDDDDDDDFSKKKKRDVGRKRKKVKEKNDGGDDDDDWTGESEDGKELVKRVKKVAKPKYSTRSKDAKDNRTSRQNNTSSVGLDDDDEDDETLGGFIVNDEDLNQEDGEDEDEEDELVEDEEDDDDDGDEEMDD